MSKIIKSLIICIVCSLCLVVNAGDDANNSGSTPPPPEQKPFQGIYKPNSLPGPKVNKPAQGEQSAQSATATEVNKYLIEELLPKAAIRLTSFITIAAFLGLLYSGFLYLTALEQTDNYEKAKNIAFYSIVGLIIAFTAYAIVQIVFSFPLID